MEPDLVDVHINVGLVFHRDGRQQEAEPSYWNAIKYVPQEVLRNFNLAVVLTDSGDRRGQIEAYERVITLAPSFAEAHCHLGNLYEAEGRLRRFSITLQ